MVVIVLRVLFTATKAPTQEFEGAVRVGYRNQDSYLDTAAVVSGALVEDVLAFRLSTQYVDGETFSIHRYTKQIQLIVN